ncbi:hypothetical protein SAIN_0820 [Streptococcus anginosus C1051]|uniref:hypothetical protein n=1 Tax=Streptococcus anginosus TaxID=1328 RepID=UPI00039071A6|nr:hypothetical protein [Streptococcus anginosus]AGU81130.1 hypothetical protein SAIN_0373 [Streptococcus anginosus C1051]AGU81568.1 hypothetical protein SAIN_0820 [Streptococcus anginosus C1051]HEO2476422.1 hypothetical protein [Streptococcus agalactiae]HEQ0508055.1 hypothetical protein [Streptococcus pyogenes]
MSQLSAYMDDLLADSRTLDCALKQSRKDPSSLLYQDTHQEARSYLERYQATSTKEQFAVFVYSSLCGRKLKRFLEGRNEVMAYD